MKKFTKLLVVSLVVLLMGVSRVNAATTGEKIKELLGIINTSIKEEVIKILDMDLVGSKEVLEQTVSAAISNLSAVNSFISTQLEEKYNVTVTCETAVSCTVNVGDQTLEINPQTVMQQMGTVSQKVQEIIAGQFTQNEDGSITANYNLFDMDFINFMYNNVQNGMAGIMNVELNTIYNYFPELQSINEALEGKYNAWFEGGTDNATVGDVVTSITSPVIAYYNEIMTNYGEGTFNFAPIILVGKGTSELEYIQEAQKRIEEYVGNLEKYPVKLEQLEDEVTGTQQLEISKFLKGAGVVDVNYTSYKAKLTIGTKSFTVYVVKVDEKVIVDAYNAITTSAMYGDITATLSTYGLDIPADVQLSIEDITDKFKDSEWIADWVLDIKLYSESMSQYITKTDNGFEIKIPVKGDFVKEGHNIWYILGDVLKEKIPYEVVEEEGQKYVVFKVLHLSQYGMVSEDASAEKEEDKPLDENPKTGYVAAITLCSVLGIGCAGAMVYMKKKNLIKNI